MDVYTIVLIIHILGVAVGAGGAFTTDLLFFTASRDKKITDDEVSLIKAGSLATWIGIAILGVSGATLLYLENFSLLLTEARFQAKFTLVFVLVFNGVLFHFIHLPFISDKLSYATRVSAQTKRRLYALVASGAVSTTTWLSILVLAYAGGVDLSYMTWIGLYLAVLAVALVIAISIGVHHFPSLSMRISKTMMWRIGISVLVLFLTLASFSMSARNYEGDISYLDREQSFTEFTPKNELPVDVDGARYLSYAPEVPRPIDRDHSVLFEVHLEVVENVCQLDADNGVSFDTWGYRIAGDEEVICGAPGPVLRGRVGDVARITLTNLPENEHYHDIDFHAVTGPGGGAKDLSVAPGETATIEARLLYPGVFMYHCAHDDPPEHISHGMYGQFIVDPVDPLPEVDHEWSISQSEWYVTAEESGLVQFDREAVVTEQPRYVTFNGTTDGLLGENALQMKTGERARIYFVNQGLNLNSNFHPIGSHWDVVYPEGATHNANRPIIGSQSTLVVAGGGSVVELVAQVPGNIVLVDHALSRAFYKGALGIIEVIGKANSDIFEVNEEYNDSHSHSDHSHGDDVVEDSDAVENGVKEFTLTAGNYYFSEEEISVQKGDRVRITLTSEGGVHDWSIDEFNASTGHVSPKQSEVVEFVADKAGEFEYYCSVGRHRQFGQTGRLIVEE